MQLHMLNPEGGVETKACKVKVFTTHRGLADVSGLENMFDHYFCIKSFCY